MCRSSLPAPPWRSQCTYRCVVLPDKPLSREFTSRRAGLNAPTGAWCSLTTTRISIKIDLDVSQCTYRCVVLPDMLPVWVSFEARVVSQCTYRCVVLPDRYPPERKPIMIESQCTYRCVVLPDPRPGRRPSPAISRLNAHTGAWCSLTPALGSGGMTPLRGPGAPPAPGAPLRTGQHRAQSST